MIYRVLADEVEWTLDPEVRESITRLSGAYSADPCISVWEGLRAPRVSNPRLRFWFTEAGWDAFGRELCAQLRAVGHTVRVIQEKEPPPSRVAYRDRYQVALLPPGKRR